MIRRPFFAALLVVAVAACGSQLPGPPTFEEANAYLARVVELAQAGDFEGLCAIGDLNCEEHLRDAGRDSVPPEPPTVVSSTVIPPRQEGDQHSVGGRVLVLCGHDARGEQYVSEMLIFRDGSDLRAITPVYWGSVGISPNPVGEDPEAPPISC